MYKKAKLVLGMLLSILFIITNCFAQSAKYVVLVTIDGFRPDFYLDASWGTPNLRYMMREGVHAKGVTSVFPSVTYPSHTTIITGVLPAKHGIYYNAPFEPDGATGRWYWDNKFIQSTTLWEAVHQAGLTSAAVLWPVTVGAAIDYNIPEIWSTEKGNDRVEPMRISTTPKGLFEEVEQQATGKLTYHDLNGEYLRLDENISRMGAWIIKTYKPNFTALHFPCVDEAEHVVGRDGELVRKAVASADYCIGKILEAIELAGIKDSTAIIVTGDHGFANIHTTVFPNVWLAQKGLISKTGNTITWKAKFQSAGGAAFLYLKDNKDTKSLLVVKKLLTELPLSQKKMFSILERPALDKLGVDSNTVLALAAIEGISFGGSSEGEAQRSALQKGTHGYLPGYKNMQTGFVGYGVGFNKGLVIPVMGLLDMAPMIAKLLGIQWHAIDGTLVPGIVKENKN